MSFVLNYAILYSTNIEGVFMEFNEKLQNLRKQKGLTQEELGLALYVSRTAISKWESGRGYPSIDSIKTIAAFFDISIDELLSGSELLNIAQEDTKQAKMRFRDLVFGFLDIGTAMLLFLPFFADKLGGAIHEVSLLSLTTVSTYLKAIYCIIVTFIIITGVATLALQNCKKSFWVQSKSKISVGLTSFATILFIASLQPYAAIFLFVFLAIKVLMLIK